MIMNPEYIETEAGDEIYFPQECEHYGANEDGGKDANGNPHCNSYEDSLI